MFAALRISAAMLSESASPGMYASSKDHVSKSSPVLGAAGSAAKVAIVVLPFKRTQTGRRKNVNRERLLPLKFQLSRPIGTLDTGFENLMTRTCVGNGYLY